MEWCQRGKLPAAIYEPLLFGVYRVTAWVVSVMLPPMALFFPMFTILEDLGYLPRVAFNLDKCFHCCHACGKQALTMCMGFGCNAVGVSGCKIISSRRERLIAMLTNCFVPCNGKFPTILVILTIFFAGNQAVSDWKLALLLTGVIEKVVSTKEDTGKKKGRMADQILTSKLMGFPVMILLLLVIFWLTIKGANYPSEVLSNFFGTIEGYLLEWCRGEH